jgi:pimeloyl-ACP methyl ester carboxylesterase
MSGSPASVSRIGGTCYVRRPMTARGLWTGALLGALLFGCQTEAVDDGPTIQLVDCAGGGAAKCGVLRVLEDPDASEGRTLDIAVVVVPASGDNPAGDPVFVLAGGPGQGAASIAQWVAPKLAAISRDRDLVFVDLRGSGASAPLACAFEDAENLGEMLAAEFHPERLADCLAAYGETDLRQYSTATAMEDLEQVRAALGYEQINFLAVSYGTRGALTYLRRHPDRVRSMVLDGVVPLDRGVYSSIPASSERALNQILADCKADAECDAVYPGLGRELEQVLTELETRRRLVELPHPRTGAMERVDVTRAGFLGSLRMALYSNESTALIPLIIHAAHRGDYGPVAALTLRAGKHTKTLSLGLYLTVSCAEEVAGIDEEELREAVVGLRWFDAQPLRDLTHACSKWRPAELPADHGQATNADAPTLLLSGDYDPVTPPSFAEHVASQLGDARHVVVDTVHHGVWWRGCSPQVLAQFFADPRPAELDVSCLDQLPATRFFLSPNGPRPLGVRETEQVLGDDRPELASKEDGP